VGEGVFALLLATIDDFTAVPSPFIDGGDHVVVLGRIANVESRRGLSTASRRSKGLQACERVAGAPTARLIPDKNPTFHELLDITQRGIG
jgi:hypothetical protein